MFPISKNITYKGILLDLDNTLYEYKSCHTKALRRCYEVFVLYRQVTYEEFLSLYKEAQQEIKKKTKGQGASHSRFLYFQYIVEVVFGRTDCDMVVLLEEEYWSTFIKSMQLKDWVVPLLDECETCGIVVCLITDLTSAIQFRKIRALGLQDRIDFVVTSEEAGVEKPDAKIFEHALAKMKLTPNDVVMIGDDVAKDIDGAKNHNIRAFCIS